MCTYGLVIAMGIDSAPLALGVEIEVIMNISSCYRDVGASGIKILML